jgi:hypothetical protein
MPLPKSLPKREGLYELFDLHIIPRSPGSGGQEGVRLSNSIKKAEPFRIQPIYKTSYNSLKKIIQPD